jgi:hypothetical protein
MKTSDMIHGALLAVVLISAINFAINAVTGISHGQIAAVTGIIYTLFTIARAIYIQRRRTKEKRFRERARRAFLTDSPKLLSNDD